MVADLKWMSQEEMIKELDLKKELVAIFDKQEKAAKALDLLNFPDTFKDEDLTKLIPDCFKVSDEDLDVEKCARMISDYEIEILLDLLEHSGSLVKLAMSGISLVEEKKDLKKYPPDYVQGVKWLWARGLIDFVKSEPDKISYFKSVDPRAARIVEEAKKLQAMDVEEWGQWRGMPSLYRWNDVKI